MSTEGSSNDNKKSRSFQLEEMWADNVECEEITYARQWWDNNNSYKCGDCLLNSLQTCSKRAQIQKAYESHGCHKILDKEQVCWKQWLHMKIGWEGGEKKKKASIKRNRNSDVIFYLI